MYELTGTMLPTVGCTAEGKFMVTFLLNERTATWKMTQDLKEAEKLTIKVEKFRQKRSLDANAYLWVLCSLIADKLSDDGVPHTKEEIYHRAIKARGIYREQGELFPEFAQTMRTAWERLGTGWVTEQVDFEPDGERVIVRFYYGSSTYNTKQMSRIIDWLVAECRELGIETKSEPEIASLVNSWGGNL